MIAENNLLSAFFYTFYQGLMVYYKKIFNGKLSTITQDYRTIMPVFMTFY